MGRRVLCSFTLLNRLCQKLVRGHRIHLNEEHVQLMLTLMLRVGTAQPTKIIGVIIGDEKSCNSGAEKCFKFS